MTSAPRSTAASWPPTCPPGFRPRPSRPPREGIAGAVAAAQRLPGQLGPALVDPAREAFTSRSHTVAGVGAVVFVVLAVLAASVLRHVPPSGQSSTDQADRSPVAAPANQHPKEASASPKTDSTSTPTTHGNSPTGSIVTRERRVA